MTKPTLLAALLVPALAAAVPDIAVRSVSAPIDATVGAAVTIACTVENIGDATTTPWKLVLVLSNTTQITYYGRRLIEMDGPQLAPGERRELELSTAIPQGLTPGNYHFGVIGDPFNAFGGPIAQVLDNTKGAGSATAIKVPSPDLVAVKVSWGDKQAADEVVPVRLQIRNRGVRDTPEGGVRAIFRLSTNDVISRTDIEAGQIRLSLPAGTEQELVAFVRLPGSLAPARYWLGFIIDPDDEVLELSETNNSAIADPADISPGTLSIETVYLPDALVGVPYVRSLTASGGDGTYVWKLVSGALPDGLVISDRGAVTGTATKSGAFSPVVEVRSGSRTAQIGLILRAYPPTMPLEVSTGDLPPAVVSQDYDVPLAATGGTPPYTWSKYAGSLPAGITVTVDGHVKGKAGGAGTNSFTVRAQDGGGTISSRVLTLRSVTTSDLTIGQSTLDDAIAGQRYEAKITPAQQTGLAPYRWALARGEAPPGMTIASQGQDLIVSGTPTEPGTYFFTLRLEDSTGQADSNTYALRVVAPPLEITTTSLSEAVQGGPYDEQLQSAGFDTTWRLVSGDLPPGIELTPSGSIRAITGTVPQNAATGIYTFLVEGRGNEGSLGRAGLSIVLLPSDPPNTDVGCTQGLAGLGALFAFALFRRRSASAALVVLLAAAAAQAQGTAEYFVSRADATYVPLASTAHIETVLDSVDPTDPIDTDDWAATIPFPFSFYGQGYTRVVIGLDGYLTFGTDGREWNNQKLPNSTEPNAVLAPFWDDLRSNGNPADPTQIRWETLGTAPLRTFVVEWIHVTHFRAGTADDREYTFQVRLGEDGSLVFAYAPEPTVGAQAPVFTATIGLENELGSEAVYGATCANNCGAVDFPGGKTLTFKRHIDLVPTTLQSPALTYAGLPATFAATIKNGGSLPASDIKVRLYISTDRTFDEQQDYLLYETTIPSLARGAQATVSVGPAPMPDLAPGAYSPILVVDPDGAIEESNETNNMRIGDPVRVGEPSPDFVVLDVTAAQATVAPGDTLQMTLKVANRGNRAGNCPWRAVLSVNDVISLADRDIASGDVPLDPGEENTISVEATIPADFKPGRYRAGAVLDANPDPEDQTREIDEFNNSGRAAGSVTVSGPLTMVTTALPDGAVGGSYQFQVEAAGGDGLYLWQLASGSSLPAGLALTPRGAIEGVPTTASTANVSLKVTSAGTTATLAATLHVAPASLVLSFSTTELPAAIFGREYETRVGVNGGVSPYAFALDASSPAPLPPGLAIDGNGVISGVPSSGGAAELVLSATDRAGTKVTQALTLVVLAPGRPVIDNRQLSDAFVSKGYEARLGVTGGRGPYKWTLKGTRRFGAFPGQPAEAMDRPPGLTVNADGVVTGTPTEVGVYALLVEVSDPAGSDRDTIILNVLADRGLAILTTRLPPGEVGREYDEVIVAGGGDGLVSFGLIDDLQQLPEGLSMRPDGRIQGTPSSPTLRTFVVRVQDDAGRVDLRALALEIIPARSTRDTGGCTSFPSAGLAGLFALALAGTRRRRIRAAIAALAIGGATLSASSCGDTTDVPGSLCRTVRCAPGETCDANDGTCKCGGADGRACLSQEFCNETTGSCEILGRCTLKQCTGGMKCDSADGVCKCGGAVCAENERCDAVALQCTTSDRCAAISCPKSLSCDPADGVCKCGGEGGVVCKAGERCEAGVCKTDRCASVACGGGTMCDPEDGRCHCGGPGGQECLYGQTCVPSTKACTLSSRCERVTCGGGMSCDPADGLCRCGGAGGDACSAGQSCDLTRRICLGGNRCATKACSSGATCDPEDGECHCGLNGPVCGDDAVCDLSNRACRTRCDPLSQTPCADDEGCFYDVGQRSGLCGPSGTKQEDATCSLSSECAKGLHCVASISGSACRPYCARPTGTCATAGRICKTFAGAPTNLGACQR